MAPGESEVARRELSRASFPAVSSSPVISPRRQASSWRRTSSLVRVDARPHGENALCAVIGRADAVAQGHRLPDVEKQLGGHARAEDGVEHLHGRKFLIPVDNGRDKAHAELPLGDLHRLRHILPGAGMEGRLGRKRAFPAAQPGYQRGNIFRDRLRRGAAHVENFDSAFSEDFPEIGQQ